MSVRRIIETFEGWRAERIPAVLATVYETLGSTYSKAGQRIVIAGDGRYQGLVSGGCLEGDLAERARSVIATNEAASVTYDMRDDADDVFGLGVGCNGLIRILLQPLTAGNGYEPFRTLGELMLAHERVVTATIIESADAAQKPGATIICRRGQEPQAFGESTLAPHILSRCEQILTSGAASLERFDGSSVLYAPLSSVPRLLILGAGLDAVPLVNMAAELGWWTEVCDHRPAYLERGDLVRADRVQHVDPRALSADVDLTGFDAAIVMSHHLVTDCSYLRELAAIETPYIGVLGPRDRKHRLLSELGSVAHNLERRLRGPIGLDIGARSPETIALSILAELQGVLAGSLGAQSR